MNWINRSSWLLLLFFLVISPIAAQESSEEQNTDEQVESGAPEAGFNMPNEIGAETFNEDGEQVTYQRLGLNPEFTFGKVGVGLGFTCTTVLSMIREIVRWIYGRRTGFPTEITVFWIFIC